MGGGGIGGLQKFAFACDCQLVTVASLSVFLSVFSRSLSASSHDAISSPEMVLESQKRTAKHCLFNCSYSIVLSNENMIRKMVQSRAPKTTGVVRRCSPLSGDLHSIVCMCVKIRSTRVRGSNVGQILMNRVFVCRHAVVLTSIGASGLCISPDWYIAVTGH